MKYNLTKKRNYQNLEDKEIWNKIIVERIKKAFKADKKNK